MRLRPLSEEEARVIPQLARAQTAAARRVRRAQIIHRASQGRLIAEMAAELDCSPSVVRTWFKRFGAQGLAGLEDAPRSGAPPRYTPETKARGSALARPRPSELGLP